MDKNAPIGVFDSGIGGLTVVREIMRQLPEEKIVYFGDTARLPYGNKSKETVIRFSGQIVRFLKTRGVKASIFLRPRGNQKGGGHSRYRGDQCGGQSCGFCHKEWKNRGDRN